MTNRIDSPEEPVPGPCSGFRVIEISTMVSGPLAGQMLGDLGAEVIKVEMPSGDPMRAIQPSHKGMSAYFALFNRNKRSIALDLKSESGRKIARELIDSADVLLENFRPDTMEKLGLGYETLRESNPGLIYAGLSGFGPDGPYAGKPAYDHVIQGLSGTMPIMGSKEEPAPIHHIIADKIASVMCSNAILAALLHRERNGGRGQKVSISLMKSYAAFVLPDILNNYYFQTEGVAKIPIIKIHHTLATKDGHVMGHVQLPNQFEGLCRMFNRPELISDERYNTPWSRISNYAEFWDEFTEAASHFTTAEVVSMAEKNGVPLGPVNDIEAFMRDPQAIHTQCYIDTEDPEYGPLRMAGFFADFETSPASVRLLAPKIGEHSDEILRELGKSADEISAARKNGTIS